jgi:PAS domain S-box-containing protein
MSAVFPVRLRSELPGVGLPSRRSTISIKSGARMFPNTQGSRQEVAVTIEVRDPGGLDLSAYEAFFEHSLDAVMYTVPDGRILAANPATCELFGLSEGEIIAAGRQGLADLSDERWSTALEERSRSGRVRCELRMRRGDGSTFLADITSVIFESGSEQRACWIIRDVTERVELLARQGRLVEELQHPRARRRTHRASQPSCVRDRMVRA